MTMNKTLKNLLERHPDKVAEVDDESASGDGYWVYLKPGWRTRDEYVHSVHEWNTRDLLAAFRDIQQCDCEDCNRK